MKKLLFPFVAIVFSTFLYSFVSNQKPIESVNSNYHKRISAFEKSFLKLKPLVLALDTTQEKFDQLRIEFVNARLDYKRIEYLLEHQSPQLVKDAFNGPPFLKLARNVAGVEIQEPTSLQYLEEAIFDDISSENIAKIKQRFFKIEENLQSLSFIKKQALTDRIFYEALRSGIIRVFSLGLAGFDVLGSGNQLGECKASWEAMKNDWNDYINKSSFKKEGKSISNLFAKGLATLDKVQDFDEFDRLGFLREIANPLFEELLVFHLKTGVETLDEVARMPISINYLTKSFLNEKYYNQFYASSLRKDDPLMKEKIELGKMLFFDPVLSSNNQRSCASCHNPQKAFTDGRAKSIAFDFKGTVDRNSPTVINAAISTRQFWDMRASILEMQSEHVITSAKEFNHDYVSLFEKLNQSHEYLKLFQNSFPKSAPNAITKDNFSQALAAYVGSLTSFNSPFDK
ncbi:MAG: cytochrome-c peroxidase, partial [Cytophagales bacterium]